MKCIKVCLATVVFLIGILAIAPALVVAQGKGNGNGNGNGNGGGGGDPASNPALAFVYNSDLYIMDADGGNRQTLVRSKRGKRINTPTWSRDGTKIAYFQEIDTGKIWRDLFTINEDGSARTLIYSFDDWGDAIPEPSFGLNWIPDESGILYTALDIDDAFVVDFSTQTVYALGLGQFHQETLAVSLGPDLDPAPGFQGLIAYAAIPLGVELTGENQEIHIAEITTVANGTLAVIPETITPLHVPGEQNLPVWSPDGQALAFYNNSSYNGGEQLVTVDVDPISLTFGVPQLLVDLRGIFKPTWSPDGAWIAFGDTIEFDIVRIRPDGTGLTNLTNTSGDRREIYPHWNPAWVNDIDP